MDALMQFLVQREDTLRGVAGATRGQHRYEDVRQQAWLEARELAGEQGRAPDAFLDPVFQEQVIRRLCRKLIHADRKFRFATRLDHGRSGEEHCHPLALRLVSDDGRDPLFALLDAEAAVDEPDEDLLPFSLALAWAMLLRRHDQRMRTVATRLLISVSHAYRCCAKARWIAAHQHPIPLESIPADISLRSGPWRRQRAERVPRQLILDFDDRLDLGDSLRAG